MVQTWNQCNDMLLTSGTKRESILLMDTETGATKSELSIRRQQKNWNLHVDSITPMQKFEQYKSTQEYGLYGLGDEGHTVFAMNHDTREGELLQTEAHLQDFPRAHLHAHHIMASHLLPFNSLAQLLLPLSSLQARMWRSSSSELTLIASTSRTPSLATRRSMFLHMSSLPAHFPLPPPALPFPLILLLTPCLPSILNHVTPPLLERLRQRPGTSLSEGPTEVLPFTMPL